MTNEIALTEKYLDELKAAPVEAPNKKKKKGGFRIKL